MEQLNRELEQSAFDGDLERVNTLIKNGASISDSHALSWASENNHLNICRILRDLSTKKEIRVSIGIAQEMNYDELVNLLVDGLKVDK